MDLVDTDVLIDVQRGHPPATAWFASLTTLPSVPGFVVMELVQDARNAIEVRKALQLVAPLPVVWPTESDCARALADFSVLHLSHSLGLLDALIAACAVGQGATLFTFNSKHYRAVPVWSWRHRTQDKRSRRAGGDARCDADFEATDK